MHPLRLVNVSPSGFLLTCTEQMAEGTTGDLRVSIDGALRHSPARVRCNGDHRRHLVVHVSNEDPTPPWPEEDNRCACGAELEFLSRSGTVYGPNSLPAA